MGRETPAFFEDLRAKGDSIARIWAEITASADRAVRKTNDLWIAATALAHGLPLVTNNRKDFEGIPGLRLLP